MNPLRFTLDTVSLLLPEDTFSIGNVSKCTISRDTHPNGVQIDKLNQNGIDYGLKSIRVQTTSNDSSHETKSIIELSAKILGDDYRQGITLNTLDKTVDQINKHGIVIIDKSKLNHVLVNRTDANRTLSLDGHAIDYLPSFDMVSANPKYTYNRKNRPTNQGVIFSRNTEYKERWIAYAKEVELRCTASGKKFSKAFPKAYNSFNSHDLRVESNLVTHKALKHYFGIKDVKLLSILNSNKSPNLAIFDRITNGFIDNPLFTEYTNLSWYDLVKRKGLEGIIEQCGYNLNLVYAVMKKRYSKTSGLSRQRKEVKTVFMELQKKRCIPDSSKMIDEIRQKLAA